MTILSEIKKELKEKEDPKKAKTWKIFFKDGYKGHGISIPECKEIAKKYSQGLSYNEAINLADSLFKTDSFEEGIIAISLISQYKKEFNKETFKLLNKWLRNVNNWAHCDSICGKPMQELFNKYPELVLETKKWTKSKNKWVKRAAAVSLVYPAKNGDNLKDIFEVSLKLKNTKDDMVEKGVGWMLKEVGNSENKQKLIDFLTENKNSFSKLTLRYACEKLSKEEKEAILA